MLNFSLPLRAAIIILAVFWIYWPSLHAPFVGDDQLYLTDNPLLHDPARLWKAWFVPGSFIEYYPIEQTLQWFQWCWWGNNPFWYHVSNTILHAVSSLLVWYFLSKFNLRAAWLGGLLFAVHPMQVESVSWISEFKNTLSLPPFLLSMCFWVDYDRDHRLQDYLLALGLFIFSMLAKISMVTFPLVLLAYALWRRRRIKWSDLKVIGPFFAVSLILCSMTMVAGSTYASHHPSLVPNLVHLDCWSRLCLVGTTLIVYFLHFFWPVFPLPYYPLWDVSKPHWWQLLPWPVFLVGGAFLWSRRKTWGWHALLCVSFFILNLWLFLGIVPITYMQFSWVMDHFLYLPMIGLIALVVAALEWIWLARFPLLARQVVHVAIILSLCVLAWGSHAYATIFSDPEELAAYTLRHNPKAWIVHQELARTLMEEGRTSEAIPQFEKSLQMEPLDPIGYYLLAQALVKQGKLHEAASQYEKALQLFPSFPEAHDDFGALMVQMGRVPEGINHFQAALKLDPGFAQAQNDWGNAFYQQGNFAQAIQHYQAALKSDPNVATVHLNLGVALIQTGQISDGIVQIEETLKIDPDNLDAKKILAQLEKSR